MSSTQTAYFIKLATATVFTGIAAGIVGIVLSALLHLIQHLSFGYTTEQLLSFLQGVKGASPLRRVLALTCCGLVAGLGWFALFRYGKKLVGINTAAKANTPAMPLFTTIIHGVLQIITVGLGSPLGREVAPREAGAAIAIWISNKFGLTVRDTQILLACGAGAGLAAVYNVPLAGGLLALEVVLVSFSWNCLIPAMATSTLAAVTAWFGIGNTHQYTFAGVELSYSLVIWSMLVGPIIGACAYIFVRAITAASIKAPKDWKLIPMNLVNFTLIGILAIYLPELLGNGKGPIQLSFDSALSIQMVAIILIARFCITLSSLRVGAFGGVLTPGLMHGALIAILVGSIWNLFFPAISMGALAITGATAFLAASMKCPITAVVLVFELTRTNHDSLVPILFATVGSVLTYSIINTLRAKD